MNVLTTKLIALMLGLILCSFFSCSKDDPSDGMPAKCLMIQAVPDLPFADFYISDTLRNSASSAVGFGNFLPYINVPSGKKTFAIAGDNQSTPLFQKDFSLSGGEQYTMAYINTVSSLDAIIFEDALITPDTTKGYLRFIHLSPNTASIDFRIKNGSNVLSGISYKKASAFVPINPGQTDYEIVSSGVVIPVNRLNIPAKKMYTVFLAGLSNASGAQALRFNLIVNK